MKTTTFTLLLWLILGGFGFAQNQEISYKGLNKEDYEKQLLKESKEKHRKRTEEFNKRKEKSLNSKVATNVQDSLALVAFYNSTNGDSWTRKYNWFTKPVRNWYGITVNDAGRVTGIHYGGNNMTGSLPPEIGDLTELQSIYFYYNQIEGAIPKEIGNCTKLERLEIHYCQVGDTIPSEIGNLTNLTELDLHINRFVGPIPAEIGNLTNLKELYLNSNDLSDTIPDEIWNLTNLEHLFLNWNNKLVGTLPTEVGDLTQLIRFDIGGTRLYGTIPTEIGNLVNLEELDLARTNLTGEIISEIGSLTNLRYFYAYGSGFTGGIPAEVCSIPSLQLFNASDNNLTGTIPEGLWTNTSLQSINFEGNQLTGTIPTAIGNLDDLYYINLANNQFTGTLPDELGSPQYMEYIYLSDNEFSGSIPDGVIKCKTLDRLELSNNQLSGSFPTGLDSLDNLRYLHIDGNQFTGEIPTEIEKLVDLERLHLQNNQFSGDIPAEIGQLTELNQLYLENNSFTGEIPAEICDLNDLGHLSISNNEFTSLPNELDSLDLWLFYFDNNLISELPDMSGMDMYRFKGENNYLTFGDLEVSGYNYDQYSHTYHPQHSLELENNVLFVEEGNDYVLNFHQLTTDTLHASQNMYSLYKEDIELSSWSSSPEYTITSIDSDDQGKYVIRVMNEDFPDLTLLSDTLIIEIKYAPTNIRLNNYSVDENSPERTYVGKLRTSDQNENDAHTYLLIEGDGTNDKDNSCFTIVEDSLFASETFDFETKAECNIFIQTEDLSGQTYSEPFTITVSDINDTPTNIEISNDEVPQDAPIGYTVGKFSATDQDTIDTHAYTLVAGDGVSDADNAAFIIEGNQLKSNTAFDFEIQSAYKILVQVEDQGGLTYEKGLVINITEASVNNISDITDVMVFAYPNPTTGRLTIEVESDHTLISVYSISGVKQMDVFSSGKIHQLDLSNLSKGVYIIQLTDDLKVSSQKILLK